MTAAAVRALSTSFRGPVLAPDHPEFDAAAEVFQLAARGWPAVVVRPLDAEDVATAVACAREHGLEIAIRSGGHSLAGHSTGEGALVIDLRLLHDISVDPSARRLRAGAGVTAGDVAAAAHEHGMTVPFGDASTVGIAGITLGGGIGYLARKEGMTIDHLVSVELVTAGGRVVTASADAEPELFWAVRGGGGNFGIATSFEYDLVDAGLVYGGGLILPATWNVLRGIAPLAAAAPEGLTVIANYMPAPPAPFVPASILGQPIVMLLGVYAGDRAGGEAAWAPFRALAEPIADLVGPMPYPAVYAFTEGATVPAPSVNRSILLETVDDDVIEALRDAYTSSPGKITLIQIRVLGGAMARVASDATAFAHRRAPVLVIAIATAESPDAMAPVLAWGDDVLARLRPKGIGAYANFLEAEGEARIREAYPASTYRRLAAAKAAWDPDNVFRRNQNIRPRGDGPGR